MKEAFNMKLVPLGDRVVLKQLIAEETTKSGIVLPGHPTSSSPEETVATLAMCCLPFTLELIDAIASTAQFVAFFIPFLKIIGSVWRKAFDYR